MSNLPNKFGFGEVSSNVDTGLTHIRISLIANGTEHMQRGLQAGNTISLPNPAAHITYQNEVNYNSEAPKPEPVAPAKIINMAAYSDEVAAARAATEAAHSAQDSPNPFQNLDNGEDLVA